MTIPQLAIYGVIINHKDIICVDYCCSSLTIHALLGIPDIEVLDTPIINCNTIDAEPSTEHISKKQTGGWYHANKIHGKMQDTDAQRQCYANIDSNTSVSTILIVTFTSNSTIIFYQVQMKKFTAEQVQNYKAVVE